MFNPALVLFAASVIAFEACKKIPPEDDAPSGLWRSVVLAAAWWHSIVGGLSVEIASWPTSLVWRFISRPFSCRVDNFVQAVVCFLLFQWLAWFIAEDYLRSKWVVELEQANAAWRAKNGGKL